MRLIGYGVTSTLIIIINYTHAQNLPYIPSRIFLSPNDSSTAYIIQPVSNTSTQSQLLSLNISSTISTSSLNTSVLTSNLPFEENSSLNTAYVATITPSGTIEIYAGSCSSAASIYTWSPGISKNGTWKQSATSLDTTVTDGNAGANFLSAAFSYSNVLGATDSQSTQYVFGGMCPTTSSANVTTWQNQASYSNRMLKISSASSAYKIAQSSPLGNKPIVEAGSTMTALSPTYSNSSSGVVTQAQNFVLLGGHTQTAFINMSQIALYSLPQESWSYQTIDKPSGTIATPDSRSGHTAVLTADGRAIVVFGGWVGDVKTAAEPQLAILSVGNGYGGTGNWAWTIPSPTGTGLGSGQGIYGHGAVLLPGNVMMVTGGTVISATSSKSTRATTSQTYLFNATSMSWTSSYTNPSDSASVIASSLSNTSSASQAAPDYAKRVGLGAGLGIGLSAVIAAVAVYFWYSKRLKRRREEARQRDLRVLSNEPDDFYANKEVPGIQEKHSVYWNDELRLQPTLDPLDSRRLEYDVGYLPVAYTPSRIEDDVSGILPRKPLNPRVARNLYQPAAPSHESVLSSHHRSNSMGTSGAIHPIYEADEEADITESSQCIEPMRVASSMGMRIGDPSHELYLDYGPTSPLSERGGKDPFRDPSPQRHGTAAKHNVNGLAAHPSPKVIAAQEREREVASWVADWTAADALLNTRTRMQSGRISPSKESIGDRTRSDLSDRSMLSSGPSGLSRNGSGNARSNSLTAYFTGPGGNWNSYFSGTVAKDHSTYRGGNISPESDRSGQAAPSSSSGSASFNTADTSQSHGRHPDAHQSTAYSAHPVLAAVPNLRPEGHSLLPRPYIPDGPGSPSKNRARRNMGWLGSLKKVFVGEEWVSASDSSSDQNISPRRDNIAYRTPSTTGPIGFYRTVFAGHAPDEPQRSTSATTMLWRRKQGREDWEDSDPQQKMHNFTDNSMTLMSEGGQAGSNWREEEEWDVERAVRERVVQVMFTVPKEKLRVVNHSVDDDRSDMGSVAGSLRSKKSLPLLTKKKSAMSLTMVTEHIQEGPRKMKEPEPEPESATKKPASTLPEQGPSHFGDVAGERIVGRRIGEVVGRPSSPDKRKSRVQEMVDKMEKEKAK